MEFNQIEKLALLIDLINPGLKIHKLEKNKKNYEKITESLVILIDQVLKSENLHKKQNLLLTNPPNFFAGKLSMAMENIRNYLNTFSSSIFSFSKTERQTFISITEILIEYFRESTNPNKTIDFTYEYHYWFERFFELANQKILGKIISGNSDTNMVLKRNSTELENIYYTNPNTNFSLHPFLINVKKKYWYLSRIEKDRLIYKNFENDKEYKTGHKNLCDEVIKFLLANLDFDNLAFFEQTGTLINSNMAPVIPVIKKAFWHFINKQLKESFRLLKEMNVDKLEFPSIQLLYIRSLVDIGKQQELKYTVQKFILKFPHYAEGYSIIGDIYFKEDNLEKAKKFYEKTLDISKNITINKKLKRINENIKAVKEKESKTCFKYFHNISHQVTASDSLLISRDRELRQIIEILLSSKKNNLLLIGDSGVGKTSLIKLLAKKINDHELPKPLNNKNIEEINFTSLLTGSKYRGQFEEKVLKLLNEFKSKNSLLVLENIHLMMSTGGSRGTNLDFINILKQFLSDGSIQVIGTTNYEEYKNTIEKDNSLLSVFQKLNLNELSLEKTKKILAELSKDYFISDSIIIPDALVDNIIETSKRNIKEKKLPDSAIMLLDRCVAKIKLRNFRVNKILEQTELTQAVLIETLSEILNQPESSISISVKKRLTNIYPEMKKKIIGQDSALLTISSNIKTSKLNFVVNKNRPDGVFLFIGPSGVGKTETARVLSKILFGSEDHLIRIDMSEYMEKYTYSKFIGAAPGYVGYYDSNQLTDKVRQNPYSVILLDEIEKADSELINIFLQIFDAGHLTDSRGNHVDFSKTTIIMTSNVGTNLFSKVQMGYNGDLTGTKLSNTSLIKALKERFSPEFLNRIDEIIVFCHLGKSAIKKIIDIQLAEVKDYLKKQKKELIIKKDVYDLIIQKGFSNEYGARNISRCLRKLIFEKISELYLSNEWEGSRHIICSLSNNKDEVHLEHIDSESVFNLEMIEKQNEFENLRK